MSEKGLTEKTYWKHVNHGLEDIYIRVDFKFPLLDAMFLQKLWKRERLDFKSYTGRATRGSVLAEVSRVWVPSSFNRCHIFKKVTYDSYVRGKKNHF